MNDYASNNKRIAQNTIFIYIRMLLIMVISLYTSRVILQTLGIEDFGTYNIVGGVVVMFTFISNAMATGTQRHISYELGNENGDVSAIFSACLKIHLWLAIIILILAETIGLWFLNTKMNFPDGRMVAINWVYQFSIVTCLIGIIQVPFTASIIAYERMSFYAYLSILEGALKLGVVFILKFVSVDKLILYSSLITMVALMVFCAYIFFCFKYLLGIRYNNIQDSLLYKKLLSFSGWSLFGSLANVGYQQGVNIVVNLFFGVGLNAAVGIANQVNTAVSQFVSGFQQALNPQLVQSEAAKDRERQRNLIFKSSKFSFFIMFIISFPLMANLPYVLSLWLGEYPDHTAEICYLILVGVLITCLSGPLWVTIYATGKINAYQIVVSSVALSVIPIIYIGGLLGMNPEQMFVVRASNYIFVLAVQLFFMRRYINLSVRVFSKLVLLPVSIVSIICISFYFALHIYMPLTENFIVFLYQTLMYLAVATLLIWFIGLNKAERNSLKQLVNIKKSLHLYK